MLDDSYENWTELEGSVEMKKAIARQIARTASGVIRNWGGNIEDWLERFKNEPDVLSELNKISESSSDISEKKWIQDAIKRPGSLRRKLHKGKGEKISSSEIEDELASLRKKDKDREKDGVQLGARDRRKYQQLNLAKTLRKFK